MLRTIIKGSAALRVRPKITIAILTFKREIFLKECLASLQKNAGREDYEILVWDNSKNNIGATAMRNLLKKARGDFFVSLGDDAIWFSTNWLRILVEAFEQRPHIDVETGFKDEWGALGCSGLVGPMNNSGMWPEKFANKVEYKVGNIWYWGNVVPHIGAVIFKTSVLRELDAFPQKPKYKHYIHSHALYRVMEQRLMVGQLRDVYVYEACSPLWHLLCPETWKAKQGNQTIEEGLEIFKHKGAFDFTHIKPLIMLVDGKFNEYATDLYNRTCKLQTTTFLG